MNTPIKLSPSDLTFLWDECKRCFYLKYAHGISRPSAPFPSVFGTIDRIMKEYFQNRRTDEMDPDLPPGRIQFGERWVESAPISLPGRTLSCYLKGKFDTVASFDDGSYGVVDFKTSQPNPANIPFYSRQLHAYSYALEHAAPRQFALSPVSRLGLLVVAPKALQATAKGEIAILSGLTWMEIPRDEAAFLGFINDVLSLLEQPEPPQAGEKCGHCQYRANARTHDW